MPTIIYVAPRPPFPLNSGMAIRQFHLLRAYARLGRVQLVSFCQNEEQAVSAGRLEAYCERVHLVSTRTMVGESFRHRSRGARVLRRLRGYRPTVVTWPHSAEMTGVIEGLARGADIVHVARLHMASHTERLLGRRKHRPRMVLDLDDIESASGFRRLWHGPPAPLLDRLYGYYELARLWAYETRAVRRFDRVLVCSERDRRRLARPGVVVVPNGTGVPDSLPVRRTDGRTIMFCGLLSYEPNIDAVHFFAKSIFPQVRRIVPDARLLIVGRTPPPEIGALHDGETIVVAADVPSVAEYYETATIAVVPLRFGGGTRIKILEAWAHGVPVVSTTIGCEGLECVDGEHLMMADAAELFGRRCVALLRSPELQAQMSTAAWRLVSELYRWDDIGARAMSQIGALMLEPVGGR
jgi:polysaccharide biosynthesis protein PslH